MTQFRISISESVMPWDVRTNARRVRTCPRKATKTVTNVNSIDLARSATRRDAVAGCSAPDDDIVRPHRG